MHLPGQILVANEIIEKKTESESEKAPNMANIRCKWKLLKRKQKVEVKRHLKGQVLGASESYRKEKRK